MSKYPLAISSFEFKESGTVGALSSVRIKIVATMESVLPLNKGFLFTNWRCGTNRQGISQIPLFDDSSSCIRSSQFPGTRALWTDSFSHLQCNGVWEAGADIWPDWSLSDYSQRGGEEMSGYTGLWVGSLQQEEHIYLYIPALSIQKLTAKMQ